MDLSASQAQAMQSEAVGRDQWMVWLVSTLTADRPSKAAAWAVVADTGGGTRQPGDLVADTLDELRAMLPRGLTRYERTSFLPRCVLETWD